MKVILTLALLTLTALIVTPSAEAKLNERDLQTITTAVREMCQHPDRRGNLVKVQGEADAGVILKFIGAELSGTIEKIAWEGINQDVDKYKTDPRECAIQVLGKLLIHFSPKDEEITPLSREVSFRTRQVDKVFGALTDVNPGSAKKYCSDARGLVVVLELGGILHFPPPKEDENVWIGSSGYGYRHIPFRSGYKLKKYERHSLSDLLSDLSDEKEEYNPNFSDLDDALADLEERKDTGKQILRSCNSNNKNSFVDWVTGTSDAWNKVKSKGMISSLSTR